MNKENTSAEEIKEETAAEETLAEEAAEQAEQPEDNPLYVSQFFSLSYPKSKCYDISAECLHVH